LGQKGQNGFNTFWQKFLYQLHRIELKAQSSFLIGSRSVSFPAADCSTIVLLSGLLTHIRMFASEH